jgi:hypothetical protein
VTPPGLSAHLETSPTAGQGQTGALLMVFAASLALGLGALWFFAPPEPNYNYRLARNLIAARNFGFGAGPTSCIEPLYPAFLAFGMVLASGDRLVLFLQAIVQRVASAGAAPARQAPDGDAERRDVGRDPLCRRPVLRAPGAHCTLFFPTTRLLAPFSAVLLVYAGYGPARHTPVARR